MGAEWTGQRRVSVRVALETATHIYEIIEDEVPADEAGSRIAELSAQLPEIKRKRKAKSTPAIEGQ